jgi:uncharacterized protein YceH (UPF0502 family)
LSRCAAIKPNGERCRVSAIEGSEWCWNHDPNHAEERRRHGSRGGKRGGRGRPVSELARLQGRFEDLAKKVLSGEVERSKAAVACQLLNGARACIRDTLTAREKEELEAEIRLQAERLAALESVLKIRSVK